jgi:16S rRNA (guanine527-N7)-methyltransferase
MSTLREEIEAVCRQLTVGPPPGAAGGLAVFAEELLRWNRRINLTGAKSVSGLVFGPLFDALTLAPVLRSSGSVVDIGSGGGLPGVPMALLFPEISLTLVEPRGKRAAFLRHIVHHLNLGVEVIEGRLEALDPTYDAAVAQAVWEPAEWLNRGASVVRPGGVLYVLSSRDLSDEMLPEGAAVDARFQCRRPGGADRFSFRVRV